MAEVWKNDLFGRVVASRGLVYRKSGRALPTSGVDFAKLCRARFQNPGAFVAVSAGASNEPVARSSRSLFAYSQTRDRACTNQHAHAKWFPASGAAARRRSQAS